MANPVRDSFVMMVGLSSFIIGATFIVNGAGNSINELKIMSVATGSLLMFMGIWIVYGNILGKYARSYRRRWQ